MPGRGDAGSVVGGDEGSTRVGGPGQQAGFCALEVDVDALGVSFADGFLAGPAAEEGWVAIGGVEGGDLGFFLRSEDAAPERGVDGVGNLDVEADFEIAGDGEAAPVVGVAEVEGGRVGRVGIRFVRAWFFKKRFAVRAATENHLGGRALEVAGEDLAHSGVGADPLSPVERGAESLGAAALAGVEGGEFGGVERSGGDLPDPDMNVARGQLPEAGVIEGRGSGGFLHISIATRGACYHRNEAGE